MIRLFLFLIPLLATGCTLPAAKISFPVSPDGNEPQAQFMNIRFARWSKPVYSGILGVSREGAALRYVLIDGSGFTLAQAQVHQNGKYFGLKAVPNIRNSGLPDLLASSLQRIYLLEPSTRPCSKTFLLRLCNVENDDQDHKYLHAGPFTVFDIVYIKGDNSTIVFSQPWIGIRMTLSPLKKQEQIP